MPLTAESIIRSNGGTFNGTSGSASLPVATTAGNTLILFVAQSNALVDPAGFTLIKKNGLSTPPSGMYRKNTAGGETSWTIAPSASAVVVWAIYEVEGLDQTDPVDMIPSGTLSAGTAASLSTGTTPVSGTFDGLVLAFHACLDTTSTTPGTWSNHTNGFEEITEIGGADATRSVGLSISRVVPALSLAAWSCTADKTAPVGQNAMASVVVLTAAGAKRAADVLWCSGAEFGTTAGLATGNTGIKIVDAITGSPAVVSTSPRSGAYCFELSSTVAAENMLLSTATGVLSAQPVGVSVARMSISFPTSLPSGDTTLFTVESAVTPSNNVVVRYVSASQKIGVKVGTGSEVLSDAVVVADQWVSIDYRLDSRQAAHTFGWALDYDDGGVYTTQTQATMAGGAVNEERPLRIGWTDAVTRTVRYDDIVIAKAPGHYPLGNYRLFALKVDPAGTLTVSGVTTNFQTFTANGDTLAAWDATVARGAIDELPVEVGAAADGFAQVANSTSAYVEIPMETFDAAAIGGALRAVRMLACGWAASTTAASIGFRAWDGVTEHTLLTSTDKNFDNTTTPAWACAMVRGAARQDWTAAKLAALAFRVGFSGDTTPAVGVHAIYGEVAVRIGDLIDLAYGAPGYTIQARMDPDSSAIISLIFTTPSAGGCTFTWTLSGTPDSHHLDASDTWEEILGATDIAEVTEYGMTPD